MRCGTFGSQSRISLRSSEYGSRRSPFRSVNADGAAAPDSSRLLAGAPARKIKQLPTGAPYRGSLSCYAAL